ncbi:hypothetical protein Pst134EA_000181, partial [Puccinia striiformis f. sp. tritici]|uniref:hypothetical protein n=1 Tax=Puccinia striiformis f. sp. tritici TaxID=168172 RepID=UPI002008E978
MAAGEPMTCFQLTLHLGACETVKNDPKVVKDVLGPSWNTDTNTRLGISTTGLTKPDDIVSPTHGIPPDLSV